MDKLKLILGAILLGIGAMSCENDDYPVNCEDPGGKEINFIGRIYENDPFHNTYYIGGLDNRHVGNILCNELPERFKKEGIVVKVKGIEKGAATDGDPIWGLLLITHIEEHNE
jgi:hypothetical protein